MLRGLDGGHDMAGACMRVREAQGQWSGRQRHACAERSESIVSRRLRGCAERIESPRATLSYVYDMIYVAAGTEGCLYSAV